jgi:hypothetical protein
LLTVTTAAFSSILFKLQIVVSNSRQLILIVAHSFPSHIGPPVKQPMFCLYPTWNPVATRTFALNQSTSINRPIQIRVNRFDRTLVSFIGTVNTLVLLLPNLLLSKSINLSSNSTGAIFLDYNDNIYYDRGSPNHGIDRRSINSSFIESPLNVNDSCHGIFVDQNNDLYCSMGSSHQVVKQVFNGTQSVAGNGYPGNSATMLNEPRGIYVDEQRTLYVADCHNDRIQQFAFGNLTAITLLGNNMSASDLRLNCPTDVIIDGHGYLFVTDSQHHRIIGQGTDGFRCLIGCSTPSRLNTPTSLSFDSHGNLLVADFGNKQIQSFALARNACCKRLNANAIDKQLDTFSSRVVSSAMFLPIGTMESRRDHPGKSHNRAEPTK